MTAIFRTAGDIRAALDLPDLDNDIREHLEQRLDSVTSGRDPFARIPTNEEDF